MFNEFYNIGNLCNLIGLGKSINLKSRIKLYKNYMCLNQQNIDLNIKKKCILIYNIILNNNIICLIDVKKYTKLVLFLSINVFTHICHSNLKYSVYCNHCLFIYTVCVNIGACLIYSACNINDWLPDTGKPNVLSLTYAFSILNFLSAIQNIVVDGWALTLLKK